MNLSVSFSLIIPKTGRIFKVNSFRIFQFHPLSGNMKEKVIFS